SPFDEFEFSESNTFTIFLEPHNNKFLKEYQNILTVSNIPSGSLKNFIKTLPASKISDYEKWEQKNCIHCIVRHPASKYSQKNENEHLQQKDIPSLFAYLRENNYTVDVQQTQILQKMKVDFSGNGTNHRKFIATCSYN
ncbi:MAG: hypothetical protein EBX50_19580, partial [Chitinophagia bacterium]|nr:hypothetical protein [Chitinophagia bacterium]